MNSHRPHIPARTCGLLAQAIVASVLCLASTRAPGSGPLVYAWGLDSCQQCVVPNDLEDVAALAAGEAHSLALRSDGTVVGWGFNAFGQTTPPAGLTNVVAIAAGSAYSLGLKADGTVVLWGSHTPLPAGLQHVKAIAAGYDHSLALKDDGTVVAWGSETQVPATVTNAVAVAAGAGQSLALRADGTVVAWGDNSHFKTAVPGWLSNVVAIAAGIDHCVALQRDGKVAAWGAVYAGQSVVPPGLSNVVAVVAGGYHCVALKADGTLTAWGDNSWGQSAADPQAAGHRSIACGGAHSLALKGDGSPAIITSPESCTVVAGQDARFEVVAVGQQPLDYQWRLNGVDIAGATNAALVLTNVQIAGTGIITLVLGNAAGTIVTPGATLTVVGSPPVITVQPADQLVACGDDLKLEVAAYGSGPLTFQWFREGTRIAAGGGSVLLLTNVAPTDSGAYWAHVSNTLGHVSSRPAQVVVAAAPPQFTSLLSTSVVQGFEFSYQIAATHQPTRFSVSGLPEGLIVDPTSGVISGMPLESGNFAPVLGAGNDCAWAETNLMLTVRSVVPWIIAWSCAFTEGVPGSASMMDWILSYSYYYAYPPEWWGASNLPPGLTMDSKTGTISGTPTLPGEYRATVSVANQWGTNVSAMLLRVTVSNAPISGLSIADMSYTYSAPYLLDFQFTLLDNSDPALGSPLIAPPALLSAACREDGEPISQSETAFMLQSASAKVLKACLVLDFSQSIATLANGDSNGDGISDAVDFLVKGAQEFVNQQAADAQISVFEFHREDRAPRKVMGFTTDKAALNAAIAGIWVNYVKNFPASSRCWDGVAAALADLGPSNPDEEHILVFVSDGQDESSTADIASITDLAITNRVKVSCVGFGAELDPTVLQQITSATGGKYFTAATPEELATQFVLLSKESKGRYVLRWATLKRTGECGPAFDISFQGFTASSPGDTIYEDTNAPPIIDTNTVPPTTNYPYATNYGINPYQVSKYAGDVTVGALRLLPDTHALVPTVTLRAAYIPRHIRQMRFHYRPNWPCTPSLLSSAGGELLYRWTLSETNDGAGGKWLLLRSPDPQSPTNSLLFGAMGNLVQFAFRELDYASNAFSLFEVDNSIYAETGEQKFVIASNDLAALITGYPVLPMKTPVPWLLARGFTANLTAAELSDPDGDGHPTWQEFRANTDPLDPDSKLSVLSMSRLANHQFQVVFNTALNRKYRLESSTNLLTWQTNLGSKLVNIPGVNQPVIVTDPNPHPGFRQIFYRVMGY